MKNRGILKFLFLFITFFIGTRLVLAVDCHYSGLACGFDNKYVYDPYPNYTVNPNCVSSNVDDYTITLDKYDHGKANNWGVLGGDEDIQNWSGKNYCPNFITVTGVDRTWNGFDTYDSARATVSSSNGGTILVLDEHLENLKSTVTFDNNVDYTCEYDEFLIDFNKDGYALGIKRNDNYYYHGYSLSLVLSNSMILTASSTPGECENLHYCLNTYTGITDSTSDYSKYYVFADELDYETNSYICGPSLLFSSVSHANTGNYEISCRTYFKYKENLKLLNTECKEGKAAKCNEYEKTKDELKTLCQNLTQYANSGESYCLSACLNYSKDIQEIEQTASDPGECGFSGRLLAWISNIFRWIKYILPVVVIILGILDFLKALGSDKDDEMKKAQGNFVKRLIAAALVFIVPLIIEFILEKMGFGYDSCGLF